ncbi:tRNA pseudouridine(38-40) synthase TruA [Hymenobacter busanensis]|uniref:tRNA pseudouridine synthase A n=1 Tax=Hymenobacter busanensis TaxID=2607656 RepID=A0A7L5A3H2_9BACT|nr:tRNA pseudouridine(38-40) synthase TruA [Hymenobacter busanensis]KAA9331278.1 tRNA pseudouridine(38-40) synthase TruA [Hymenobacter busanensis]QHJ08430.1 tRNA pseudouridine(38-40) synthase TruA [Hymenobacter busanensis]
MRYFLELAYDGTRYHGWQVQPNALSVQQELDRCLSQVLRQPISTLGSGRTDTGVHASHQVAHFDAEMPAHLDETTLLYRLNRALPPDIGAHALSPVRANAHARFDGLARSYEYHVTLRPDPFKVNQALWLDKAPDVAAMNEAAAHLLGQRDFTSFSKTKGAETHYVCWLHEAGWHSTPHGLVFRIRANRFVRGMVRLVVGTLLDVGRGRLTPAAFTDILHRQQRIAASGAAPAHGLYLSRVEYAPDVLLPGFEPAERPYFVTEQDLAPHYWHPTYGLGEVPGGEGEG